MAISEFFEKLCLIQFKTIELIQLTDIKSRRAGVDISTKIGKLLQKEV